MAVETADTESRAPSAGKGPLVYRQPLLTRITHWTWALALFFMLLSGLQIFNAHPALYVGQESGFEYDNSVLAMYAANSDNGPIGQTRVFGQAKLSNRSLDVHICALRKKVKAHGLDIDSVRGVGYRLSLVVV